MKLVEDTNLLRINNFLDNVDVGDYYVSGELEAYSCKLAGVEKALSKSIDDRANESSPPGIDLSKSPMGPLSDSQSRRTLVFLILTLNQIYPDYDFSELRAHHFRKEDGSGSIEEHVDSLLLEVSRVWEKTPGYGDEPFLDSLWSAIDEAITLKDSDVYSYQSDLENDPFGEKGNIWSFNYFFYNKKLKRIVYLSCRGISKKAALLINANSTTTDAKYNSDDEDDETSKYGMAALMDL